MLIKIIALCYYNSNISALSTG